MEVMFLIALVGFGGGFFGYLVGHVCGGVKWQAMYIEEQNKRVEAENAISHLKRTGECLSDKVIQQQKMLEQFNAESA